MKKLLTNNLGWKLLSILLALILWLVVINMEDPYITKEFSNIPVKIMNEEKLTAIDKAVEIVSGEKITIKFRGRRKEIDTMKLSDITAVADLQYVTLLSAVTIDITTNKPSVEILQKSHDSVIVKVEDVKYGQFTVDYNLIGTPQSQYVMDHVKVSPNKIEINGQESQFAKVKRVVVDVNIDESKENVILTAIPKFVDDNGNEVVKINSNIKEIQVEAVVFRKKTVPISISIEGTVQPGYKLTQFEFSPENITIFGNEKTISTISSVDLGTIDISNIVGEFRETIYINQHLPSNIKYDNESNDIAININVEKLEEATIEIPMESITVTNYPAETQFRFISTEPINFTVRGLQTDINKFLYSTMLAKVSLNELEIGKHSVSVELIIPTNLDLVGEVPKVDIELSQVIEDEIGD